MILALVTRVKLEKDNKPFVIFGKDTVRNFLELMLIYFGSNRNISDLENRLWAIYKDILSFLVFGKSREISNLKEESYIISLENFNEAIDKIFAELTKTSCDGVIVLASIFICSERIKAQDDEYQFGAELQAEEQDVENYIAKKFVIFTKNNKRVFLISSKNHLFKYKINSCILYNSSNTKKPNPLSGFSRVEDLCKVKLDVFPR